MGMQRARRIKTIILEKKKKSNQKAYNNRCRIFLKAIIIKSSVILAQTWADRPQIQKLNSINSLMYKWSLNL